MTLSSAFASSHCNMPDPCKMMWAPWAVRWQHGKLQQRARADSGHRRNPTHKKKLCRTPLLARAASRDVAGRTGCAYRQKVCTCLPVQRLPFWSECRAAHVAPTEMQTTDFADARWNAMKAFSTRWLRLPLVPLCGCKAVSDCREEP